MLACPTMVADDPSGRHALSEAELLAKVSVKEWVRCTLREVALQSLQRDLSFDNSRGTVSIKRGAVERARGLCSVVGKKWIEKIRIADHFEVGEWIANVLETESDALFHTAAPRSGRESTPALPESHTSLREASPLRNSSSSTGLSRLDNVGSSGVSDVLSGSVSVENAIKHIDDLAALNGTDWPFPWPVVQEACDDIITRLHNSKKTKFDLAGSTLSRPENSATHQLLPLEAQGDEADEFILRRKRKSRCMIRQLEKTSRFGTTEGENTAVDREPKGPTPRPAASDSHQQWAATDRALSDGDQKNLEENYIHSDDLTNPTFSTLLGPLKDAGRFHHSVKHGGDDSRSQEGVVATPVASGSRTVRQVKWQKRVSINERLGNHRLVNQDTRGCSNASRIQRTIDGKGLYWLDFDLGQGLLDAEEREGDVKRRKLLFFDSLEVSLLDEDLDVLSTIDS